MDKRTVLQTLGRLLMLYSISLIPVILIAIFDETSEVEPFAITMLQSLLIGSLCYMIAYDKNAVPFAGIKEGFLIVILYWFVISLFGSLPFILSNELGGEMSISDAIFESFSGLTTTGATVLTNIDELSLAIKYYRQQLQWIGGMGIIILAVAVLPMLGVGGIQLYKTESVGPFKNKKLTPRVYETARSLWLIYLLLTVACIISYYIAGMNLFDAVSHGFSTISIGGFSTYDDSIGHFNSLSIEIIATIFMVIAGMNFVLHYATIVRPNRNGFLNYFKEVECRTYLIFLFSLCLISLLILYTENSYQTAEELFRYGIFQTISIATTTGFTNSEWYFFPLGLPMLLLFSSFVGGCSGSTAGGIKIIRFVMILKQGFREVLFLIHPNSVRSLIINNRAVSNRIISSVSGFFAIYLGSFCILILALLITGMEPLTAFSALAACLNNLGPGLEGVSKNYQELKDSSKLILSFAMLLGRLEFYTLLVILTPTFWRT